MATVGQRWTAVMGGGDTYEYVRVRAAGQIAVLARSGESDFGIYPPAVQPFIEYEKWLLTAPLTVGMTVRTHALPMGGENQPPVGSIGTVVMSNWGNAEPVDHGGPRVRFPGHLLAGSADGSWAYRRNRVRPVQPEYPSLTDGDEETQALFNLRLWARDMVDRAGRDPNSISAPFWERLLDPDVMGRLREWLVRRGQWEAGSGWCSFPGGRGNLFLDQFRIWLVDSIAEAVTPVSPERPPAESEPTHDESPNEDVVFLRATETVESLRAQLEEARRLHREDVAIIGEHLGKEAVRRDWCSEYEDVISSINEKVSVLLEGRSPDRNWTAVVDGWVRVPFTRPYVLANRGEPTEEEVARLIPGAWRPYATLNEYGNRSRAEFIEASEWNITITEGS